MAIEFACTCGQRIRAPDATAGRPARCPNCGVAVIVPSAAPGPAPAALPAPEPPPPVQADQATKTCPACAEKVLAEAKKCRHCGEWFDRPPRPAPPIERDLPMEAHLQAISIWMRAFAVVALAMAIYVKFEGAAPGRRTAAKEFVETVRIIFSATAALSSILLFWAGQRLFVFSSWGRRSAVGLVRFLVTALAIALVFIFFGRDPIPRVLQAGLPIAWGGAALWVLDGTRAFRVCNPDYVRAAEAEGDRTAPLLETPFLWAPLVLAVLEAILWWVYGSPL